jgi:hypothetical protein
VCLDQLCKPAVPALSYSRKIFHSYDTARPLWPYQFALVSDIRALQHDPEAAPSSSGGGWTCEIRNKDTGRVRRISIIEFVTVATAGAPRLPEAASAPRERLRDRDAGRPLPWDDLDAHAVANRDWFLCGGSGGGGAGAGDGQTTPAAAAVDSPRSGTDSPRPGGGGIRRPGSSSAARRPQPPGGSTKTAGSVGKTGRKPAFGGAATAAAAAAGGGGGGSSGKRRREVRPLPQQVRPLPQRARRDEHGPRQYKGYERSRDGPGAHDERCSCFASRIRAGCCLAGSFQSAEQWQ